ncbi:ABC transporter ATP-binding protein [Bacillus sp. Marseille-P3661]|uniref:ABC transporter ATP-binding protein n=1 Tax=Bacillus sp. Marseille-P3661 TaxID=1936234 RepID=UPI000C827E71|nr:ABC transporter ATP-binding protein [Bacillus sp. Marseille-P3661]
MISLINVSYRRDGRKIIENINWDMKSGENWAILGLNGAGKTTLLNIITGYTWPSTGEVTVLGKKFGTYPVFEVRKQIGFVSSSMNEMIHGYDYAENIVLSGKYASIGLYENPEQEDIDYALALLEKFRCNYLIHRSYETLSQGEKQKVLIMRALMAKPKLLILDEPCAGLDVLAREQVLELIEMLANDPVSPNILLVTHHIEEIVPGFEYMLMLKDGEIFSTGKTKDLLTNEKLSEFLMRKVRMDQDDNRYYLRFV